MARFLLDAMCGGLDAYLRMCGHDAAYALDRGVEADDEVLAIARAEDRLLVTRDRDLAARADRPLLLTERDPVDQLVELAAAGVDLTLADAPSRCGRCNGPLERAESGESVPEYVPDRFTAAASADAGTDPAGSAAEAVDLWRCRGCGQYFWKGDHWERVAATLSGVRERVREEREQERLG